MRSNISTGNCGEYFVAAELERRGFSVAVPMSNTPIFDLLAIERENLSNQIALQVKTTSKSKNDWAMSPKNEIDLGENVFYVFVKLNGLEEPHYYIVPSSIVAKQISEGHRRWLETPGRNGQRHNDSKMRKFIIPKNNDYKDAWDLLYKKK